MDDHHFSYVTKVENNTPLLGSTAYPYHPNELSLTIGVQSPADGQTVWLMLA
jgi:hypothetical protein